MNSNETPPRIEFFVPRSTFDLMNASHRSFENPEDDLGTYFNPIDDHYLKFTSKPSLEPLRRQSEEQFVAALESPENLIADGRAAPFKVGDRELEAIYATYLAILAEVLADPGSQIPDKLLAVRQIADDCRLLHVFFDQGELFARLAIIKE